LKFCGNNNKNIATFIKLIFVLLTKLPEDCEECVPTVFY